jgi:predicted DNA-binding transcriptional regulator YafY
MNLEIVIEKLEKMDRLNQLQATGSPKELAGKLCVSERTVYRYIRTIKNYGSPIYFCKKRNSYCYRHKGGFCVTVAFRRISG